MDQANTCASLDPVHGLEEIPKLERCVTNADEGAYGISILGATDFREVNQVFVV
jgi:hypothetical protein